MSSIHTENGGRERPESAKKRKLNNMPGSDLATLLALFKTLSDAEKVSALQFITKNANNSEHSPLSTSLTSPTYNAHSCFYCQRLIISKKDEHKGLKRPNFHHGTVKLSKQDLAQGINSACLLFRWIFRLLDRALVGFKAELSEFPGLFMKYLQSNGLGTAVDELDFLDAQIGIEVQLTIINGNPRLSLICGLEPVILDRLWEILPHEKKIDKNYHRFISEHLPRPGASSFEVYTDPDDPAATEIPTRASISDVGADSSYQFARKCLQTCQESHPKCSKGTGTLPSRLIDVGTRFPVRNVKLYWSEEGERGTYAALSYCWGGQQPLKCTQNTAQDFTDGIAFAKLPQTIQDAVVTTIKLGIRYVWIDCLCIIQDDYEDMAREVANMARIFEQASVTISASSARSIHEGFLKPRLPQAVSRLKLPYQKENGTPGSIFLEKQRQYNPEQEPISLRAWTLQEHMLSPRILDYSTEQLWWLCSDAVLYDNGKGIPIKADLGDTRSLKTNWGSLEGWRIAVRDYTKRFLTFPGDKLPAISGIAAQYGRTFGGAYLAGLWEWNLPSELLWSTTRSDISRPARQRAPSWSWASVDGEINHNWCDINGGGITIIECRISPVSPHFPYGSVDPLLCSLKVRGDTKRFFWSEDKRFLCEAGETGSDYVGRTQGDADEFLPRCDDALDFGKRKHYSVWALIITYNPTRGLILTQIGEDTFRRAGVFFRLWDHGLIGFQERTITLL